MDAFRAQRGAGELPAAEWKAHRWLKGQNGQQQLTEGGREGQGWGRDTDDASKEKETSKQQNKTPAILTRKMSARNAWGRHRLLEIVFCVTVVV